ncbi:MAG: hypothetical protein E3K32_07820 [wastewater metagenome]|nr:hypothetical protein [Candidatus Loosdrechtia aerotolerans]
MGKNVRCFFPVVLVFLFIFSYTTSAYTQSGIVSDDFSELKLKSDIWTFINPLGDATLTMTGTDVSIFVPAGTSHDIWHGGALAPRIMQAAEDTDFEIEVKFVSGIDKNNQMQGLIIEQDDKNYLRFDFSANDSAVSIFAVTFVDGFPNVKKSRIISDIPGFVPLYMRIERQGDKWIQSYSYNRLQWFVNYSFTHTMAVTSVGIFAGNFGDSDIPEHTVSIDYFFNVSSPVDPEDGGNTNPPGIDVWYGDYQRFGHLGMPQRWVNILGRVSDPELDEVISLTYSLNGKPEIPLSTGPDGKRLNSMGDFNIDVAYEDLMCGQNQVTITATDTFGNTAKKVVDVRYNCGNIWPDMYSIDWGSVSRIEDVAQVVDGLWTVEDGRIRTAEIGYDRMIAIGDILWEEYEITAPVIIHQLGTATHRGSVGFVMRWKGHYDWDGSQPLWGWYPFGAFGGYDWFHGTYKVRIFGNTQSIAEDTNSWRVKQGVEYFFKMRVETVDGRGMYFLKIWEKSGPEPLEWDLKGQGVEGELHEGSLLLLAHYADVSFGNITINPGPFNGNISQPTINDIHVKADNSSATINWTTEEPSTSKVYYGLTPEYEYGFVEDTSMVTSHSLELTELIQGEMYHYKIVSANKNGNSSSSADLVFTVSSGLRISYGFEEEGDEIAIDSSGNYHNGTIKGAVWTTGKTGGGLHFDGIDDYVSVPRINNQQISISAWFYKHANDTKNIDAIFGGYKSNSNEQLRQGFDLRFHPGAPDVLQFIVVTKNKDGIKTTRVTKKYLGNSVGRWFHVVGTYDKKTGKQKLFVNGELVRTETHPAGNTIVPLRAYPDMRIGHTRAKKGYFNGIIDDVRLYRRTLYKKQVLELYNK